MVYYPTRTKKTWTMERITAAAIRLDGVVYTGPHHHWIIYYLVRTLNRKPIVGEQGFMTSLNRYVDREEGAKIAIAAGQITELKYNKSELFSEELWVVPYPIQK